MERNKRPSEIFTRSYMMRNSIHNSNDRPSFDYNDVDFDALSANPIREYEVNHDVIDIPNSTKEQSQLNIIRGSSGTTIRDIINQRKDAKRLSVFKRLGTNPHKSPSRQLEKFTQNIPINDCRITSNDIQDTDNTKQILESSSALETNKTNKMDTVTTIPDIINQRKDAKRISVFERLGKNPHKSPSQQLEKFTQNISINDCRIISNDIQDTDNTKPIHESSSAPETNKTNKMDTYVGNMDLKAETRLSGFEEIGSRKRSRSHSSESDRRKVIKISSNFVGVNIEKEGPSDVIQPLDSLKKCVQENAKDDNRQRDREFVIPEIRDKRDPVNTPNTENKLSTFAILPDLTEIESCGNCIVDSDYETEEGYLRRLFMVHRQDFIRPLSRGFMSLKHSVYEDPNCLEKGWRHDDIRVYKNITFLTRCCNEQNGLTWKIRFDITPYRRISWNTEKLLTFGSLVCFTNRNFSFLKYATVAERNANDLKKGIFEIKFTETNADVNESLKQPDVLLIESNAYFPSSHWPLRSLKSMHSEVFRKETALPFGKQLLLKTYIVEKDVPDYFKSSKFAKEKFEISCLNSKLHEYKIDISIEAHWPSAELLGLDDSQHSAIITSMKKKLALIQGPPGTGKTVVGLKIAELLLKNEHIWREQDNQGPMLLLSYTNHALDQFLLSISTLLGNTDAVDIVRLGSRSEVEILKEFNLTAKRKAYTYTKEEYSTRTGEIRTRTKREISCELNVLAFNAKSNLNAKIKEHENLKSYEMKFKQEYAYSSSIVFSQEKTQTNQWFWDQYNENEKSFLIKKIEEKLSCTPSMSVEEACAVSDIWSINNPKRWQLYNYWIQQSLIPINKEIKDCEENYKRAQERFEEIQQIADIKILKKAKLVASTTSRAARDIEILKRVSPSIVLIEEAAEIPEHHVVACLTSSCQQLIMIGDHQQLRPSYNDYKTAQQHKLNISLFERLIGGCVPYTRLEYQHRMSPMISKLLVPHIYRTLKDDLSVNEYEDVRGIHCNVFFLSHLEFEDQDHDELSRSHKNEFEASFICKLYRYLRMQGYSSSKITILTTYSDQVRHFYNMIRTEDRNSSRKDEVVNCPAFLSRGDEPSVRITTVDNFQGEENDIILLSLVRSNMENEIGYLSEANRVCVALSRAKKGLYVVGNFELLKLKSPLWKNIVNDAEKEKCFGTELQLTCQNHKNTTYVSKPDDFDKVSDGGCEKPCKIKRQCGHICLRKCHVDDPDHEGICPNQCHRQVCEMGHRCIKPCHYPNSCEKCNAIVVKTIPKCQHRKRMPCHKDPQSASCDERCQAIISCGHRCRKQCTDSCNIEDDCKELVKINARCGHEVTAPCYTKYDAPCKLSCKGILKCGHVCKGTHSECSQGRLHKPCEAKCARNLVCGHICKGYCNNRCPPCTQICDRKCIHGDRCKNRCGDSCIQCTKLCKWACKAECPNKFKCGKVCMKLFVASVTNVRGLLCEISKCVCKVCENLTEIPFGYEEDNAILIRLEDCTCVLEVNGLDQYISSVMNNTRAEIKSLKCPNCSTNISKSNRYSNELKVINKNVCEVFQTIQNIEEGTDLNEKQNDTRQKLTDYEIDLPHDIFTKLQEKVENARSADILNMISDQLTFYEEIHSLRHETVPFECRRLIKAWLDRLEKWVFLMRSRYARQEHNEFYLEIRRLQLTLDIHEFKTELSKKAEEKALPDNILNHLLKLESTKVMDDEELSKIRKETEEVSSKMIGLTLKEKQMIKRAMEKEFMGSGHWYKCKNEHYYSIGECGMPMEQIKCPQCGVPIGGADHILTDDNERAMDFENL
ncbi:LOW QUALITY PROTEIN: NFX1-type zinc finger-containing protein 1-like [Mytilus edulis]|uniref:LOW QUALITY PROTEIN: NFX1-type zinc finger-containing protein 1-like n=1 Tax=Mytilus edulis TaxID=6550 RepID=UPI0039F0A35F